MTRRLLPALIPALIGLLAAALLSACASLAEPPGPPREETLFAVTDRGELVSFSAGRPERLLTRLPLQGLSPGEALVGIDFRLARGSLLYALSDQGRLYTVHTGSGVATRVGRGVPVPLQGRQFGVDFNPVIDRLRVVSDSGQNLRVHPDTGLLAAIDRPLHYGAGDAGESSAARVMAVAHSFSRPGEARTTHYAIDQAAGTLVMQGTPGGVVPAVSPNQGWLRTVGPLGTGPVDQAALDIAPTTGAALAALRQQGQTRLYLVDLETGRAQALGTLGDGGPIRGLAIAP